MAQIILPYIDEPAEDVPGDALDGELDLLAGHLAAIGNRKCIEIHKVVNSLNLMRQHDPVPVHVVLPGPGQVEDAVVEVQPDLVREAVGPPVLEEVHPAHGDPLGEGEHELGRGVLRLAEV